MKTYTRKEIIKNFGKAIKNQDYQALETSNLNGLAWDTYTHILENFDMNELIQYQKDNTLIELLNGVMDVFEEHYDYENKKER